MSEVVYGSLQYVSDADLQAMAGYLRSIPPSISAQAGTSAVSGSMTEIAYDDGRRIYSKECARCHGDRGEGRAPGGPPLVGNRAVTMVPATNPIRIVLFGGFPPGTRANARPFGMPPYYFALSDDHIANVLNYVRTSWGNSSSLVLDSEVAENRGTPLW